MITHEPAGMLLVATAMVWPEIHVEVEAVAGTIGLDNEVDRQAVGGPCPGRPGDGHQCSSGAPCAAVGCLRLSSVVDVP